MKIWVIVVQEHRYAYICSWKRISIASTLWLRKIFARVCCKIKIFCFSDLWRHWRARRKGNVNLCIWNENKIYIAECMLVEYQTINLTFTYLRGKKPWISDIWHMSSIQKSHDRTSHIYTYARFEKRITSHLCLFATIVNW